MDTNEIDSLQKKIQSGVKQLGLTITSANLLNLVQFVQLLIKWNKAYNLTSIRDIDTIVVKHILDSFSIAPFVKGKRILDVGTGAGFPGLPLALILPELNFVLLDSNGKKTRFLTHVIANLSIFNVEIVQSRVETYFPGYSFDSIVVRAFSSIDKIINCTNHLRAANGRLLVMKGNYPAPELEKISEHVKVYSLLVPGLEEQRHLVCIEGKNSG